VASGGVAHGGALVSRDWIADLNVCVRYDGAGGINDLALDGSGRTDRLGKAQECGCDAKQQKQSRKGATLTVRHEHLLIESWSCVGCDSGAIRRPEVAVRRGSPSGEQNCAARKAPAAA